MEIKNFREQIRIGKFPNCLDVGTVPGFHSDHGIVANFFVYRSDDEEHFTQLRRMKDTKHVVLLCKFKWEEQLESLPDSFGEVLWDSRKDF